MLAAGFYIPRDADPLLVAAIEAQLERAAEQREVDEVQAKAEEARRKLMGG